MTTVERLYLPRSGSVPATPAVGSQWEVTTGFDRLPLSTSGAHDATNSTSGQTETSASVVDRLHHQYVESNTMAAKKLVGTFKLVIQGYESTNGADIYLQCVIRVVSGDGSVERGVLYGGQTPTTPSSNPADPNGEFSQSPAQTRVLPGTVTPLTVVAGDRKVVELGCRHCNTTTASTQGFLRNGAVSAHSDLADTAGTTTDGRPYIEFTWTDPPNVPTSLGESADEDSATLTWSAPSGGDAATGYEVRIDGGAAIDVGNTFTHTFTGLDAGTDYLLEVRAYNAAGSSAWEDITSHTTDPPGTPTGLDASTTTTTATLTWDASTGSPDGYDVRIDGGSPIDVGAVLTYDFTGLTPATTYTLEVRAYNEAGDSGWASIEATTGAAGPGYTADITVGDHSWSIDSGAPAEGDVLVLDSLRIGWEVDEADPWPAQPNAVTCALRLWTYDVAELDDTVIGTPLSIVLTDVSTNVFGTFHGRVARQSTNAMRAGPNGLGMLYTLTGVDYTVDLAELPIQITEEWPAEPADDRFARIAAAILAAGGVVVDVPADTGTAAFEALSPAATNALALLSGHLEQVAIDTGEGPQRYIVAPVVVDGVLDRFSCTLLDRVVDSSLLPGVLDVVDGVLVLAFPNMTANGVVDAAAVELDTTWNRLKYRAVNQVTVSGETVTAMATRAGPPIRLNLSTTLTDQDAADLMAALYLPDVDETNGWVADAFTLHAVDPGYDIVSPESLVPAWFPDHRNDPVSTSVYVMPLAIVGIPAAINLAGDLPVYAGQLVKVDLTLSRERVLVDFALRRQLPSNSGDEAVTWEWVLDEFPTLTWEDVDPNLSWYDARLARRP